MTYHYTEVDPSDALYNAARKYPGGIPALALRLQIPAGTLQKKLSPAVKTHVLGYEEAIAVIELLDEAVPAEADLAIGGLLWRLNRVALRLPAGGDVDSDALVARLMQVFSDEGVLAEHIREALADKRVNQRELARIEKDIQRAMEDLATLRNEVRRKHERDAAGEKR